MLYDQDSVIIMVTFTNGNMSYLESFQEKGLCELSHKLYQNITELLLNHA